MKSPNAGYECSLCGALFTVPPNKEPIVMFIGSRIRDKVRTVTVDGREIHRCRVRFTNRDV